MSRDLDLKLLLAGMAGPLVFFLAVALGAAGRDDYSHLSDALGELLAVDAPHRRLLVRLFDAYQLLVLLGAVGLYFGPFHRDRPLRASAMLLGASAAAGLVVAVLVPTAPRPAPPMIEGAGQLLFALSSLTSLLVMGFAARGAELERWDGYAKLTWVAAAVVLVASVLSIELAAIDHPLLGLCERVAIGSFLTWLLVTSAHFAGEVERA